jgi:hypothetical protein
MKLNFLFILLISTMSVTYGQEIELKTAITTSAGGSSDLSNLNISKWRLGQVHTIVFESENIEETTKIKWKVRSYPNPFEKNINLGFITKEEDDYSIKIYDISGKHLWLNEERKILPNQVISLDLSFLPNALYLVMIKPLNAKGQKVFKVQKQ